MARILIVDDTLMIRALLRDVLTAGGHEVVGDAADGVTAEYKLRSLKPDLVTLDLVMPVRSGLATLPTLLEIDPSLVVVVCSASADQHKVLRAIRLGAHGFIPKPFRHEGVLAGIDEAIARANGMPRPAAPVRVPIEAAIEPQPLHPSRREFRRVTSTFPIRVTPADGQPIITTTVDLGGGGALLNPVRLRPQSRVGFRLELGHSEPAVEGRATVARVDGAGRPALAFDHVSVEDHERLVTRISRLADAQLAPA